MPTRTTTSTRFRSHPVWPTSRTEEPTAARKPFFPSSIGPSFLVAPAYRGLVVTASRGNYTPPATHEAGAGKMPVTPLAPFEAVLRTPLSASPGPMVPHTPITGIPQLHVVERMIDSMAAHGAEPPPRARSVYRHLLGPHPHEKAPDRTNRLPGRDPRTGGPSLRALAEPARGARRRKDRPIR